MSWRTPLGRVLGLGSAKDGVGAWMAQRVSSVALVPLGLWFAASLAWLPDFDYDVVVAWVASPFNTVALLLLLLVAAHHARLGLQVVVEDYIPTGGAKMLLLLATTFVSFAAAAAGAFAVLRVSFGVAP